jgi:hypothetical protein
MVSRGGIYLGFHPSNKAIKVFGSWTGLTRRGHQSSTQPTNHFFPSFSCPRNGRVFSRDGIERKTTRPIAGVVTVSAVLVDNGPMRSRILGIALRVRGRA